MAGLVPTADPRDLDPASVFLTAAAAAALRDAGIGLHGSGRERYGLIVGTTRVSAQSAAEFRCSIDERGLAGLSVRAFARIVLNASAGACSKVLALKGPHTAITTGRDSGLAALVVAAGMASRRDDVDLIVAGGVDELPLPEDGEGLVGEDGLADGAACVVVGPATAHDVEPWASPVRLAGWAVAGPGRTAEAVERALRMAGVGRDEVDLWYGGDPFDRASDGAEWSVAGTPRVDPARMVGTAEASGGMLACVAAVQALREGRAGIALVTSGASRSAACAVLLAGKGRNLGT